MLCTEKGKELEKVLSSFPSSEFESDVPESSEHIVQARKVQLAKQNF